VTNLYPNEPNPVFSTQTCCPTTLLLLSGPFALPLIGNLLPIMRMGLHEYMMQCRLRYGKTFKVTQQHLPAPSGS
jgi:hypothetical protein